MRPELVADCPRCHHTLWRMRRRPFEFPIACGLAAAFFYAYALLAPFLEITAYGRYQQAGLTTGPVQLALEGFQWVAALVLAATVILPGLKLGLMLTTLIGLRAHLLPPALLKRLFRWYTPIGPWAMVDVYLLGFLVAYTRLSAIAQVHLDTAVYSLVGLMISMAAADAALDNEAVWRALDDAAPAHGAENPPAPPDPAAKYLGCHCCEMVNLGFDGEACRRCGTTLRTRKHDSIARSWALVIAAIALYLPANIYPVMIYTELAQTTPFTIMAGIAELAHYGLWPLALLVFLASITIPLMKLLILIYILITTQLGSHEHLVGRTRAFRLIDFIGRWSMIDVFMISILVALVRFQQFANIFADTGAPCFAAVVVLTMLAVEVFDPRLMWDGTGEPDQEGSAPLDPPLRPTALEPLSLVSWVGRLLPFKSNSRARTAVGLKGQKPTHPRDQTKWVLGPSALAGVQGAAPPGLTSQSHPT